MGLYVLRQDVVWKTFWGRVTELSELWRKAMYCILHFFLEAGKYFEIITQPESHHPCQSPNLLSNSLVWTFISFSLYVFYKRGIFVNRVWTSLGEKAYLNTRKMESRRSCACWRSTQRTWTPKAMKPSGLEERWLQENYLHFLVHENDTAKLNLSLTSLANKKTIIDGLYFATLPPTPSACFSKFLKKEAP